MLGAGNVYWIPPLKLNPFRTQASPGNKWQFTDDFVKAVYTACVDAGIDYMEIGYFTSEKYFKRGEVTRPAPRPTRPGQGGL